MPNIGDMWVAILNSKTSNHIMVKDVLYYKDLAFTLISLPKCNEAGFEVLLYDNHCTIHDPNGTTICRSGTTCREPLQSRAQLTYQLYSCSTQKFIHRQSALTIWPHFPMLHKGACNKRDHYWH